MKLTKSPKLSLLLDKMGIFDCRGILDALPRRYESFCLTPKKTLLHMRPKEKVVIYGELIGMPRTFRFQGKSVVRFSLSSFSSGLEFQIEAWNRPYLSSILYSGETYTLTGSYEPRTHCLNMINIKKGEVSPRECIQPVYSLPADFPQHLFRSLVKKALKEEEGKIEETLPSHLKQKYRLLSKEEAYRKLHFPLSPKDIHEGMRAFKYEEALFFTLKNQLIRKANKKLTHKGERKIDRKKVGEFVRSMPFSLTPSQRQGCREILLDMEKKELMNRLLQGDVGTGKTLVAGIAAYCCFCRNEQTALMAPTEALARQHYAYFLSLFKDKGVRVGLLVGSMQGRQRKELLRKLGEGEIDVIVGTHALFSKDVVYQDLGLAIIDEQHKFGVNQRSILSSKGSDADLLLMSATPIPRTLSMTLYGDLDVSTLKEFPFGQREVESLIVKSNSKEIKKRIDASLEASRQVFVIVPQIEESGNEFASAKAVYEKIEASYPGKVSLMHGKLSEEEKLSSLAALKDFITPILVATSVVEVGIDVKEAGLMIVYEARHFSLSSLHQLRGRIGRDGRKATFMMVYDGEEEEKEKLEVILHSDDGFEIAEADLRLRGPGTLAGVRQSGFPDFNYANLVTDFRIFEAARGDAKEMIESPKGEEDILLMERLRKEGNVLLDS